MAQNIKLKRSSVPGKVPTTAQLEAGEIAINTADGKLYFERDDSTVQTIVTTNALVTGSLNISGAVTASYFQGGTYFGSHFELDTNNTSSQAVGRFNWSDEDGTATLGLKGGEVMLQLGQEMHYNVINQSGDTIPNGSVVYATGVSSGKLSVALYIASSSVDPDLVLGLATEDIPNTSTGFVTNFGKVREVNTSAFPVGTVLYASSASAGGYTDIAPLPPARNVLLGFVTKQGTTDGEISVDITHNLDGDEVLVNLSGSNLTSTNVQSALLELDANKASVDLLSSNINLYPTTGSSPISGYFRMVTEVTDPDYNNPAVDISTGPISGSGQFISALASDPGIFIGNPGVINVTTIGNIRRVSGTGTATFYFEMYQRSGSVETLIATSNMTSVVDTTIYTQFNASALLNNGTFLSTDRIVIKYYGERLGLGSNPVYEFQFGGDSPVKTLLPVPVSVIPSDLAIDILTDTTNFNNILSGADTNVQAALDTLDDHSHTLQQITTTGNITTDRIIVGDLTVNTSVIRTTGSLVGFGTENPDYTVHVSGTLAIGETGLVVQEGIKLIGTNPLTVTTIPVSTFDGAFLDYIVYSGTNRRAGTVAMVWSGSNVEWNDTSTLDLGSTSGVEFALTSNGTDASLSLGLPAGTWTLKGHLKKM